jgi:hypothetical protein
LRFGDFVTAANGEFVTAIDSDRQVTGKKEEKGVVMKNALKIVIYQQNPEAL